MTNTTVTNVSDMLLANVTAGAESGKQKISEDGGFTQVMNTARQDVSKTQPEGKEDAVKTSRTVVETPKSKEIASGEPVKKDPIANEDDMAEFTEEVAEAVASIFNKIEEVLEVTEEELQPAMETLAITAVDLFDPANVKDLCMELTDTEDSISLLTNADLYENVKEIVQMAEDAINNITEEFGLTTEEAAPILNDESFAAAVNEAVEKLTNTAEAETVKPDITPDIAVIPKETSKDEMPIVTAEIPVQTEMPKPDTDVENKADATVYAAAEDKEVYEAVGTDAKAVTVEVTREADTKPEITNPATVDTNPAAKQGESVTETFTQTAKSENNANLKGNNEGFEHASRFAESEVISANTAPQTTVVNTEVNNLGEVVETVTTYTNEDANSIMSQVTQSIRVNYTADTTSLEMQLHPASLGTVNMNIASTNGVVTAHIIVQNEAVRAALESQLITLQQTFEEQGQKIEAVEVSVANYDLNRGTGSDTGSDSQGSNSNRAGRVGTRRRINLNDLDEDSLEELSDDEKITADMMARSGNSVDYRT